MTSGDIIFNFTFKQNPRIVLLNHFVSHAGVIRITNSVFRSFGVDSGYFV